MLLRDPLYSLFSASVMVQTGFSCAPIVLTTSVFWMSHILMLWSTDPLNRYFSLGESTNNKQQQCQQQQQC